MEHSYWGPKSSEQEDRDAMAKGIAGSNGQDGVYGEFKIETITDEDRLTETNRPHPSPPAT